MKPEHFRALKLSELSPEFDLGYLAAYVQGCQEAPFIIGKRTHWQLKCDLELALSRRNFLDAAKMLGASDRFKGSYIFPLDSTLVVADHTPPGIKVGSTATFQSRDNQRKWSDFHITQDMP